MTDSRGSFESMKNPINTRLRHVNLRYHRIRQAIKDGDIELHLVRSEDMLADILTKNLDKANFERLRRLCMGLGVKPTFPRAVLSRMRANPEDGKPPLTQLNEEAESERPRRN